MGHTFTPKVVRVRGLEIAVNSWEELDELIARYGAEATVTRVNQATVGSSPPELVLTDADRALLERFVKEADRGVPVGDIRAALGRGETGKVGSALKSWAAQIGLEPMAGDSPFELRQRASGRVHRLTNDSLRAARILLSR